MYAKIALGGCRVVADLAAVRLVAASVLFAAAKARMSHAVHAEGARLARIRARISRVLLAHVNIERLAVLVMPVATGTLELFACIARVLNRGARHQNLPIRRTH